MKTITICKDVTVTYTIGGGFDRWYKKELARDREEEIKYELRLALQEMDPSDPNYSDIYKDVYGVRPRWQ